MTDWNDADFFVLWRSIWGSPNFRSLPSAESRLVMMALFSEVQWSRREIICKHCGAPAAIQPGDVFTSQSMLADMCCCTRSQVRTAFGRLKRSKFLTQRAVCAHLTIWTMRKHAEFKAKLKAIAKPSPDLRQTFATKEDVKDVKEELPIGGTLSLLGLPGTNPNAPFIAVADHFQKEVAGAGGQCRGWKKTAAYQRNHRKPLSQAIRDVAERLELTLDRQRKIISWAVQAPPFEVKGEEWTWLRVLDCDDPGAKWRTKAGTIAAAFDRAGPKKPMCKLTKYSPGPGAPFAYYRDDEPISATEYYKLGGK